MISEKGRHGLFDRYLISFALSLREVLTKVHKGVLYLEPTLVGFCKFMTATSRVVNTVLKKRVDTFAEFVSNRKLTQPTKVCSI